MARTLIEATAAVLVPVIQPVADDPRQLKPGQLCRLLNSTPLGQVIDDRRLRRHRERAGTRIGDGRSIDLLRYAGWLAVERHHRPPGPAIDAVISAERSDAAAAYDRKREAERARNADKSRQGRNIGPLPDVVDPKRRARGAASLRCFAETYFAERLYFGWSDDLLEAVRILERIIFDGGNLALTMPRGGGKTTLITIGLLWAVLNGYRKFAVGVTASKDPLALQMIDNIKRHLLTNEMLYADYPEAIHAFRKLDGQANRSNGQHLDGKKTFIKWRENRIVFPAIEGSPSSGAILHVCGLGAAIRGLNADGVRPDMALLDDIQTPVSARNPLSVTKRLGIIDADVLGLAGPGKTFACYAAVTIMQPNDVAAQLVDRSKRPEWNGLRFRMLHSFPKNMERWRAYWDLRQAELGGNLDGRPATPKANAFYSKHRKEMDEGAIAAWDGRKLPTDVSAVQHAMNLYFRDPRVFASEYQNEPIVDEAGSGATIDVMAMGQRTNGLAEGVVPNYATHLVAHIDVHDSLLYWKAFACDDWMTGAVVKYGCWPKQEMKYFAHREAHPKLSDLYEGAQKTAAVRAGLIDLLRQLRQEEWHRLNGVHQSLELVTIDWGDGEFQDVIAEACRFEEFRDWVMPAEGFGWGPEKPPMDLWPKREEEQMGHHWVVKSRPRKGVRVLRVDAHYWKSIASMGLTTPIGNRGSIALYGDERTDHRMTISHYTAEACQRVTNEDTGRTVGVWTALPNRDNHRWDNLVNCLAAASFRGARIDGTLTEGRRPRMSLAELAAGKSAAPSAGPRSDRKRMTLAELAKQQRG